MKAPRTQGGGGWCSGAWEGERLETPLTSAAGCNIPDCMLFIKTAEDYNFVIPKYLRGFLKIRKLR